MIVTKLDGCSRAYTDAPFATLLRHRRPCTHEAPIVSAGSSAAARARPSDREPRLLEDGRGLPLGVDPDWDLRAERDGDAGAWNGVVLYTDGLVERRDRPLDAGLELLSGAATEATDDTGGAGRLISSG